MSNSKKKKSIKSKKEKASTQDFSGYTQTVEEMLDEAVPDKVIDEVVETPKTVSNEPPVLDMELAKRLTGHPVVFEENHQAALACLVVEGIAADFGAQGHARGFKWRGKVKR